MCGGRGERRGSRDELGLKKPNASRAPSRAEQILSVLGHLPLVLPDGAVTTSGRKQRGREVRKMLKDKLEVQVSQKLVQKK